VGVAVKHRQQHVDVVTQPEVERSSQNLQALWVDTLKDGFYHKVRVIFE
jgi:hypothetical protein